MIHAPDSKLLESNWFTGRRLEQKVPIRQSVRQPDVRKANATRQFASQWRVNTFEPFEVLLRCGNEWRLAKPLALVYSNPHNYYWITMYDGLRGVRSLARTDLQNDDFIIYDEEAKNRFARTRAVDCEGFKNYRPALINFLRTRWLARHMWWMIVQYPVLSSPSNTRAAIQHVLDNQEEFESPQIEDFIQMAGEPLYRHATSTVKALIHEAQRVFNPNRNHRVSDTDTDVYFGKDLCVIDYSRLASVKYVFTSLFPCFREDLEEEEVDQVVDAEYVEEGDGEDDHTFVGSTVVTAAADSDNVRCITQGAQFMELVRDMNLWAQVSRMRIGPDESFTLRGKKA